MNWEIDVYLTFINLNGNLVGYLIWDTKKNQWIKSGYLINNQIIYSVTINEKLVIYKFSIVFYVGVNCVKYFVLRR